MKKDVDWQWTLSHLKVFETAKNMITADRVLPYFNLKKPITVQVDASMRGLGAALLQSDRPVPFASKALSDAKTSYANIERELLAVVFECEHFHTYVFGTTFTVESDHKPLEQIQYKNIADTPLRLQRMMLRIQPYDATIKYRPSSEVVIADTLSRLGPLLSPEIQIDRAIHSVSFSSANSNSSSVSRVKTMSYTLSPRSSSRAGLKKRSSSQSCSDCIGLAETNCPWKMDTSLRATPWSYQRPCRRKR